MVPEVVEALLGQAPVRIFASMSNGSESLPATLRRKPLPAPSKLEKSIRKKLSPEAKSFAT